MKCVIFNWQDKRGKIVCSRLENPSELYTLAADFHEKRLINTFTAKNSSLCQRRKVNKKLRAFTKGAGISFLVGTERDRAKRLSSFWAFHRTGSELDERQGGRLHASMQIELHYKVRLKSFCKVGYRGIGGCVMARQLSLLPAFIILRANPFANCFSRWHVE